jgi:hypothetical protein
MGRDHIAWAANNEMKLTHGLSGASLLILVFGGHELSEEWR